MPAIECLDPHCADCCLLPQVVETDGYTKLSRALLMDVLEVCLFAKLCLAIRAGANVCPRATLP